MAPFSVSSTTSSHGSEDPKRGVGETSRAPRQEHGEESSPIEPRFVSERPLFKNAKSPVELVALLESEEGQLNAVQGDLPFEVVLFSGAADHVADNVDAPGYAVEPSTGSKAGAAFIAANGARIPNRGQMTLALKSEGGQPITSTFQVCQTNRPLMERREDMRRRMQSRLQLKWS